MAIVKYDFDGDGRSDLFWARPDGGGALLYTTWLSTGSGFAENRLFSQRVTEDWAARGSGDFDGDGRSDILWRKSDGQLTIWRSNGVTFDATFNQMVERDWNVETVGDFNGDGRSDIFWRRNDGLVTTWLANATGEFDDAADPLEFVAPRSPSWRVQGAGDVNGDGFDDVVWQRSDLEVAVWTSNGTVPVKNDAWNQFPPSGSEGFELEVGRFTADARDDIFVWNEASYIAVSDQQRFLPTSLQQSDLQGFSRYFASNVDGFGMDELTRFAQRSVFSELTVFSIDTDLMNDGWIDRTIFQASVPSEWYLPFI